MDSAVNVMGIIGSGDTDRCKAKIKASRTEKGKDFV